jgi:hypothetical protein
MILRKLLLTSTAAIIGSAPATSGGAADSGLPVLRVKRTDDFAVTGDEHSGWRDAPWTVLHRRGTAGADYTARFKLLYSENGIYVLLDGSDRVLTASFQKDFEDLWTEDVFEVFLWTDERFPVYFEYEISPLERELPILIPNFGGTYLGWRPWHYEGPRRTRKAVRVFGGPQESGASIAGWRAEIFIPYDLLKPLQNVPPQPGTRWRANFYRVDHDHGQATAWDWARVGDSFHEYQKFGTLVFE